MQAPTAAGNPSNIEMSRELNERLQRIKALMDQRGQGQRVSGEGVESLRNTADRLRDMLQDTQQRQERGERAPGPIQTGIDPAVLSHIGLELGVGEASRLTAITGLPAFMRSLNNQNAPQGIIDVFNTPEVADAINAGIRGDSLAQVISRVALNAGQNVHNVMGFASPFLLSQAGPAVRATASGLGAAATALDLGINQLPRGSAWRNPAETIRRGIGMVLAGAPYVGAYMLIEKGLTGLKELFNYDYHNKEKLNQDDVDEQGAAIQLEAALRQFEDTVIDAPDDDYADEKVQSLNNILFQGSNITNYNIQQKQQLEKQYEDSVLSALKTRLASVISNRLPKLYFTTGAMRNRAVQPVLPISMWALEGYPPKII